MLGWLLRVLLVLVIARAIWKFLVGLVQGATGMAGPAGRSPSGSRAGGGQTVPLVKDPVCGTYVVKERALTAAADGTTHFFCSDRCRNQWAAERAGRRSA
jgi:YHS domain-containing protein